jgi:hypothetical protein
MKTTYILTKWDDPSTSSRTSCSSGLQQLENKLPIQPKLFAGLQSPSHASAVHSMACYNNFLAPLGLPISSAKAVNLT